MPATWKHKCPNCGGRLKLVSRAGGVRTYQCVKCKARVLKV